MKLPNPAGLIRVGKTFVMANRPEILFGASVVSTVGAVVLAAKGGYEARGIIDAERLSRVEAPEGPYETYLEYRNAYENHEKTVVLTPREMANLTWHCYLPAATLTIGSLGSTTGLHLIHIKEKKQLATVALAAIEEIRSEAKIYEKALLEADPEKSEEVRNEILEKNSDNGVTKIENSDGELEELYLIRDALSGRDIWSSERRIGDAVNTVNAILATEGDTELNYFYSNAGFGLLPMGSDLGWSGELIELHWDTTMRDDGRPVKRFTFRPQPKKGYGDGS